MTTRTLLRTGLGALAALCAAAAQPNFAAEGSRPAPATNSVPRQDFSDFKIITDRNIFNQRRYARSGTPPRENRSRSARVDSITLVGTMAYDKGTFAFFEGSRSEYRKVLTNSGEIAEYKIAQISNNFVKLVSGTNEVKLPVGMQLRREEEGKWRLASPPESAVASYQPSAVTRSYSGFARPQASPGPQPGFAFTNAPTGGEPPIIVIDPSSQTVVIQDPNGEAGTNTPPTTTDAGAGDNDVLRRLMQRREQEINR